MQMEISGLETAIMEEAEGYETLIMLSLLPWLLLSLTLECKGEKRSIKCYGTRLLYVKKQNYHNKQ